MSRLLEALRPHLSSLGPRLASRAFELGLAVTRPEGTRVPISVTLSPVVIARAELERRHALSRHLASAGVKMARAILAGPDREALLGALSPLERKMTERQAELRTLATTRIDFFVDQGRPWALELNTTIPAMQGYSDIAAQAFIEVVGAHARLTPSQLRELENVNVSNARALHSALVTASRDGQGKAPERIALLCRRNDAQISELEYLAGRFAALGTAADIVHPDALTASPFPRAGGQTYDLVYRHLFVRRLEETPAPEVVAMLERAPGIEGGLLVNPPSAVVEVKATFAYLSEALSHPERALAAGLNEGELAAIREAVPWTRLLRAGPTTDPDGKTVVDLVERVAAEPKRFVLKRSWDYGGRAVFIGSSAGERSFEERVKAAYGEHLEWRALCRRAARDPVGGGFVVQERVPLRPEAHWLCTREGIQDVSLYVDYSAYASVNLSQEPAWGGVCRGSSAQVVNIVGGGGVLPLLTEEVAERIAAALERV